MRFALILMLAPFAFATGAYVFSGLLDQMATDLGVSVVATAQLQTAFTIACAVGGPLLAVATARFNRRRLLIIVLVLLAFLNALSAVTTSFSILLFVRLAAGFVGALTVPVASAIAVMLVSPERRPAALAAIIAGNSLAFLFGVPLGSFIGSALGWNASFWFASALCASVAVIIPLTIPASDPPPPPGANAFKSVLRWPLTGLMLVTLLSFTATFSSVGLIGPVITAATGLTGGYIGLMQMLVGIGSVIGLPLGARLAGAGRSPLPFLLAGIVTTQLLYAYSLHLAALGGVGIALIALSITLGAICLFACSPIIQSWLAIGAGPNATIAFACNGSMIFLGQGLGTIVGGGMTTVFGLSTVGIAGAIVALFGLVLALQSLRPAPFAEVSK